MSELDLARANFRVVLVLDQNHKEAEQQMVELDQLEKADSAKPSATSSKGDAKVRSKLDNTDKAKSSATSTKNPYEGMFEKMAKRDSKINTKLDSRDKAKSSATSTKNPYKGMFDKMAKTDSKVNYLTVIVCILTPYVSSMAIILINIMSLDINIIYE